MDNRVKSLESAHPSVVELIGLLDDVKSALKVFVKCGNALKWILGLAAPLILIASYYKKWRIGE